ncbi:uncharacterized protein LOC128554473 [Mercenaria mercenaria]|uniref:uncharacterized protein LOC128554473 n=1 Tax=Mercenaria mercenaria TaxID=6596 RepID=UPI00234F6B54|nr:uncharacterized protein LOC128554473 [Mercenaria mercenaria]
MEIDESSKRFLGVQNIIQTNLRPDIVLWSQSPKKVILVELTVPWEERTEEAYERKLAKYQDLADACNEAGWKTHLFPVEVGSRGFPAQSLWRMLGALGIKGKVRKATAHAVGKAAESVQLALVTPK